MKKLILFISIAFAITSCNEDDQFVLQENNISSIQIQSTYASIDKNEIPVDFTFYSGADVQSVTMNIDFDGIVKVNGSTVTGNFLYHLNDNITLTPNNYGRTTALVSIPEHRVVTEKDFYTVESNSEPYVFVNNLINRAPQHSNGKIFYETTDGSSYSVNKVQVVVVSAQSFNFTVAENKPILNTPKTNFGGTDLLSTFELGLLNQNYGSNNFTFNFANDYKVDYPFNYVKTYIK